MSDKYPGNLIIGPSNGYSVYFNGVNSYLTFTKDLGLTADFTVEFWLYLTAQPTQGFYYMGVTTGPYIATEALKMLIGWPGTWAINPALPMPFINRWNHMALVRTSGTVRLYVNGISTTTASNSSTFGGSQQYGIGAENTGGSIVNKEFYMSSLRVSNIARYSGTSTTSANFGYPSLPLANDANTKFLGLQTATLIDQSASPVTITANGAAAVSNFYLPSYNPAQLDPALGAAVPGVWTLDEAAYYTQTKSWPVYDPSFKGTTLLLHGTGTNGAQNNTFLDSSTNNFTITRTGNTTQGSLSPFSQTGWSVNFNRGTLTTTLTGKAAGTGSVTYELFFYSSLRDAAVSSQSALFNSRGGGTGADGLDCAVLSTGDFQITTSGLVLFQSATNLSIINNWYHLAIVRNGTTNWTVYLNGTSIGTFSSAINLSSVNLYLGAVGGSSQDWLKGYISNFRYTRAAVYTSNFTPPTAPLTVIANTEFLSCLTNQFKDISANNFTITPAAVNGTLPAVQSFAPFAPAVAYTPSVIGGSGYFDGTGDYLTVPTNAAFQFGTGDFTIEAWIYNTSAGATDKRILVNWGGGAGAWQFYLRSNNRLVWQVYTNNSPDTAALDVPVNAWTHVAWSKSGTNAYLFINGVLKDTTALTQSANGTGSNVAIGSDNAGGSYFFGNISNLRVVKGTAVYTANFTPPTAPVAAISGTSLLTNFTNAGILDSTAKNVGETINSAQISTAVRRYGPSSMLFDGTSDYVVFPSSTNFELLADFTMECWIYPTTIAGPERGIFGIGTTDPNSNLVRIQAGSAKLQFWLGGSNGGGPGTGTKTGIITCSTVLNINTWYHIALVRSGSGTNNVKLYLNGVLDGQGTGTYAITAYPCVIGGGYPLATIETFFGYISDFRVTKNVARYLANFTPPTSQLQDQ